MAHSAHSIPDWGHVAKVAFFKFAQIVRLDEAAAIFGCEDRRDRRLPGLDDMDPNASRITSLYAIVSLNDPWLALASTAYAAFGLTAIVLRC